MSDVRVISRADALSACPAFQHNFQQFVGQRWTLSHVPGFTRSLRHWSPLSTPVCRRPTATCPGIVMGLHVLSTVTRSLVQVLSDNAEDMSRGHKGVQPGIQSNTKVAYIKAGLGFWTYVDWDLFCHLSDYYIHLKPANLLSETLYAMDAQ
jgi:hypothetical protein